MAATSSDGSCYPYDNMDPSMRNPSSSSSDRWPAPDMDDPANGLVFTLLQSPQHGTLYLGDRALAAGGTFTQFDIDHGLLSYEADEPASFSYEWANGTPSWESGKLQPVVQANLTVPENGESVIISFEGEGAGYRHFIGWHRLDAAGRPTEPRFLWADAAEDDNILLSGTTFTLEGLAPGTEFGLFIVPVGASIYQWLPEFVDAGAIFRFDTDGNIVAGNNRISAGHILYSGDGSLNPDGVICAKSGIDGDRLMISFEELLLGRDKDYRDLVVSVRYEGSPTRIESDSFSFVAMNGADILSDMNPTEAGYAASEDRTTFNITINPSAQAA